MREMRSQTARVITFFCRRRSVLVEARLISKREAWRLTERDRFSASFSGFTTGHTTKHSPNVDLVEYDVTEFCFVSIIVQHYLFGSL